VSGLNARLFAFYGPGLPTTSHYAIGNLVDQAIHSNKLTLNGNGMATRSYMPGNVMAAVILYVMKTNIEGATHIGSSEGRTLGHWAELVANVAQKEFDILGTFDDSNDKYVPENDVRIPSINFTQNPREVLTDWIAHLAPN
jgi:dTDP-glucose 4,6-dehydratase